MLTPTNQPDPDPQQVTISQNQNSLIIPKERQLWAVRLQPLFLPVQVSMVESLWQSL